MLIFSTQSGTAYELIAFNGATAGGYNDDQTWGAGLSTNQTLSGKLLQI